MKRQPSHIYVLSGPPGLVKVGFSCRLERRVAAVAGQQGEARLEWATPLHEDPLTIEMMAHTLLRDSHVVNEWFCASVEDAVRAVCSALELADSEDYSNRKRHPTRRHAPERQRKGRPMGFRLKPAELAALKAAARADMRKVSEMARKIINDHLRKTGYL